MKHTALLAIVVSLGLFAGNFVAAQVLTTLHSFTVAAIDGRYPQAGLVQGSDGNFYGTTSGGGTGCPSGCGTVFRVSPTGGFTNLYSFMGYPSDGDGPNAALVQGSDGNFYGTTSYGGSNDCDCGIVFRISPSGSEIILHSFSGSPNDGAGSSATLAQGRDGNFYGTTVYGGANNNGTVYRITSSGSVTILHSFKGDPDGAHPVARLVQGSDGNFYGTTHDGGTDVFGTVFRISPTGDFTNLYSFIAGTDGAYPQAGLAQGRDGNFYGTTSVNGGSVFRISPDGSFATLYSFSGGSDGSVPQAELVQGSDGNFYGTTSSGGTDGFGTLFRISPSGSFATLYSFSGGSDGSRPQAGLVQGSDGDFYGTTLNGGMSDCQCGTVFKLSLRTPPPGDVNGDSRVTSADSLLINQVLVGLRSTNSPVFQTAGYANGDVNQDGRVTSADSLLINQQFVGLRSFIVTKITPNARSNSVPTAVTIFGIGFPTNTITGVTIGPPVNLTLSNVVAQGREQLIAIVPAGGGIGTGVVNVAATPTNGVISFGRFINQ